MRKIRKGDNVQIMKGKDAGKQGEVLGIVEKDNRVKVVVKGLNIVKRAQKPNTQLGIQGGIVEFEKPIDVSNVMLIEDGKPVRVGFKVDKKTGKKLRVSKKTGKEI